MFFLWWCPFKIWKEKWAGLQFTSTDYLSIVLTPVRIRWTIPLSYGGKNKQCRGALFPTIFWLCLCQKFWTISRWIWRWCRGGEVWLLGFFFTTPYTSCKAREDFFTSVQGQKNELAGSFKFTFRLFANEPCVVHRTQRKVRPHQRGSSEENLRMKAVHTYLKKLYFPVSVGTCCCNTQNAWQRLDL